MKRNFIAMLLLFVSLSVFAGDVAGYRSMLFCPSEMYFLQLEGGYTWNSLDGINVAVIGLGNVGSRSDNNGLSGRIGFGVAKKLTCTPVYITGEIGWGYYGNTNLRLNASGLLATLPGVPNFNGISLKSSENGFDVLAGILYNQPYYELFLKGGALIQNSQINADVDLGAVSNNNINGDVSIAVDHTQVLPEIKLGGAYHINANFGLVLAWAHVFGFDRKIAVTIDPNNPLGSININLKNPSMNIATVGLEYRFA